MLFCLDAERSHHLGMGALSVLGANPIALRGLTRKNRVRDERLQQSVLGLNFQNPIGLAAGFDKNAQVLNAWSGLGFGFVEVGSVTPKSQPGNPKPRLFRIPESQTIQNAMGFNNDGMARISERIRRAYPLDMPLGVNLGKNKVTPNEKAIDDYLQLISTFDGIADYFVINLSSPNTPGLRDLENPASIRELVERSVSMTKTPILLKVSPDSEAEYTVELCETAVDAGAQGIIATNTSIDYSLTPKAKDTGGLSGGVLRDKSYSIFTEIAKVLYGRATLISVGGIDSGAEAYRRFKAGASLVQVYTALIYEGPGLIRRMNQELLSCLQSDGYNHLTDAIGTDRN